MSNRTRESAIELAINIFENKGEYLILDTETSGLTVRDQVIELAIINLNGRAIYNERFKLMEGIKIHPEASKVNGIYDADLAKCPTFKSQLPLIKRITKGKRLLAYNANFDDRMLNQSAVLCGSKFKRIFKDIMRPWSDYNHSSKYLKLKGGDHTALGDCMATLECINEMAGMDITNPISYGLNMVSNYFQNKLEEKNNDELKTILDFLDNLLHIKVTQKDYELYKKNVFRFLKKTVLLSMKVFLLRGIPISLIH